MTINDKFKITIFQNSYAERCNLKVCNHRYWIDNHYLSHLILWWYWLYWLVWNGHKHMKIPWFWQWNAFSAQHVWFSFVFTSMTVECILFKISIWIYMTNENLIALLLSHKYLYSVDNVHFNNFYRWKLNLSCKMGKY